MVKEDIKQAQNESLSPKGSQIKAPFGFKYHYIYRLVRPVERNELYFNDGNICFEFNIDESFIHIRLRNKSKNLAVVRLNESQILIDGRTSQVSHFNYVNEFQYSLVSLKPEQISIFPNSFVILHLAPSSNVYTNGEGHEVSFIYPAVDYNDEKNVSLIKSNVGKRVGLFIPIEVNGEIYDYYFEFKIMDVRRGEPFYPKPKSIQTVQAVPSEIVIKGGELSPSESFIASTLISFFVLISAYFLFAKEKGKI